MKKTKNNNDTSKPKSLIKRLIKFCLYFALLCVVVYGLLWCVAYWKLESYKIDMDEMMSFDPYDNVRQE